MAVGLQQGQEIFSLLQNVQSSPGPTQTPVHLVPGVLLGGLKWLVHEADYSRPSSAKVKNFCCYTSVLLHVFMMCTGPHTSLCGCEPRSVTLRDDVRVCTGVI